MIKIKIDPVKIEWIKLMAKKAEIGGKSQIREGEEREKTLSRDQLTGQLASYGFCIYWFGDFRYWMIDRFYRNQNPYNGDNGFDIAGMTLDVKGSRLLPNHNPETYRLPVRPKERHDNWVYIHAVVDYDDKPTSNAIVYLLGWAYDNELPIDVATPPDPLDGAHILPVSALHPLPEFKWKWLP